MLIHAICFCINTFSIILKVNGMFSWSFSIFKVDFWIPNSGYRVSEKKQQKNKHQLCYRETTKCKMNNEHTHSANMNILVSGKIRVLNVSSEWADLRTQKMQYMLLICNKRMGEKDSFVRMLKIKIQKQTKKSSHTRRLSQR